MTKTTVKTVTMWRSGAGLLVAVQNNSATLDTLCVSAPITDCSCDCVSHGYVAPRIASVRMTEYLLARMTTFSVGLVSWYADRSYKCLFAAGIWLHELQECRCIQAAVYGQYNDRMVSTSLPPPSMEYTSCCD